MGTPGGVRENSTIGKRRNKQLYEGRMVMDQDPLDEQIFFLKKKEDCIDWYAIDCTS